MDLAGKTVVVTGAGRGLGLAIARAVGLAGGTVVLAEYSADLAAAAAAELRAESIEVHRVDTNVASSESVAELARQVAELGPLHGLVNNAALANGVGGKYFPDIPVAEWDRLMAVNVRGPWLVAATLYPQLAASGAGRIVNISSDAAFYGSPRLAHYVTSKGAIVAMTRAMARDAGKDGITVNALAPGLTEGEATEAIPAERFELYRYNRAIDRPQRPEDLTGAVSFLLSPAASYITGQTLLVDGGFVCR
ncbi:NAD(P)-dependent dehydrogenase (short-subunit alcohol dehydrogenase family) [Tamaricihabitans halophyticus]|uniref:NAD(P)-dependent dehydrogenase (Short-subunit alcohol dehydrogenase family) n=1 Tax=Tamaricihabitans halophyticus TaxID=1262583 RepID=A0A4R2QFG6_9PSEU|nr:SDR family oxidoreductase [Tamaricihabitans halophyticus]TCP45801.1 NAD(P)-dependent dehydrogenase (short-subunit alcohol dehydrogenase family) [Tamaricihabitans halophyticus]